MQAEQKTIFITGASSGIGLATARMMAKAGHAVYGTSRSGMFPESHSSAGHAPNGFTLLKMDVCRDEEMEGCLHRILQETGKIDVLIVNAGTGIAGSVEDTSIEEARSQFETNYFGALRVVRAVLPVMRLQGGGSIVAVSSVAGVLSIPFQSGYSASKFALEASMEALRSEVGPFGIRVCLVEPGDTKTGFTGARTLAAGAAAGSSPYSDRLLRSVNRMARDEQNGASPDKVAKAICQAAFSANPPVRIAVGLDYRFLLFLKRLLPHRVLTFAMRWMYAS